MSVYAKKVQIIWDKTGYGSLLHSEAPGSISAAEAEINAKTAEMIAAGEMSDDNGVYDNGTTVTVNKRVTDQAAADEWIAFNTGFAAKYGYTLISSKVFSSTI